LVKKNPILMDHKSKK